MHQRNAFGRNENVPKGEIDFYRYWDPIVPVGNHPRGSYYMVDARDVGELCFAMDSTGNGPGLSPPNWQPGADIADKHPSWCIIDTADYDTAVKKGWYLKPFDQPL